MAYEELPRLNVVYVKELAAASGLSEKTIRARMKLWDREPGHPEAIPYRRDLGRPWRCTREQACAFLSGNREALTA